MLSLCSNAWSGFHPDTPTGPALLPVPGAPPPAARSWLTLSPHVGAKAAGRPATRPPCGAPPSASASRPPNTPRCAPRPRRWA